MLGQLIEKTEHDRIVRDLKRKVKRQAQTIERMEAEIKSWRDEVELFRQCTGEILTVCLGEFKSGETLNNVWVTKKLVRLIQKVKWFVW